MTTFLIVVYCICAAYMVLNFKHDIHMLQQNSYRIKRYWKYLNGGDLTSTWRLVDVALLLLVFSTLISSEIILGGLICIACIVKICLILNRHFKKPLVFTKRVWRIYGTTTVLTCGGVLAIILSVWNKGIGLYSPVTITIGTILIICVLSWLFVILATIILNPVEKLINRRYWNEASAILKSMPELKVIGITGSYGKTSTKHYLERILSEEYDVLMTPGSFNTPMGVIRTIREMMKPYHTVFICEMGAKQKGDIKEICDLVHPHIGIITAVGPMHLESFKSMENVQSTKFELADALPSDGIAVINDDFEYCSSRQVNNVRTARYSLKENANTDTQYSAREICYSKSGTTFTIVGPNGFELPLATRLIGACNISNLIAAVIVAIQMKVPEENIRRAVYDIKQVEHRLSIRQTPGGVTIIDDAFNSNPEGSRMALEVLSNFQDGRRIVITPGMIELGASQHNLNYKLGTEIAKYADLAYIVGHYNRDALREGILDAGFDESSLHLCESFIEAQRDVEKILQPGDTILYENDLPDSFK